jgi:hypothetical protein
MAQGVRLELPTERKSMHSSTLLAIIEQHRRAVLSSPFVLAFVLALIYIFGGNEFRRVIDFFAPGRIFGH